MRPLRQTHRRLTKASTALLLVIQALGGGAVTLAHAAERGTAPAAIEARHDARCVVLHDAVRCAVCQYAGARFATPRAPLHATADVVTVPLLLAAAALPAGASEHLSAPPRAPPAVSRS